ncbi:ABC transporter substrate-binding protein [Pseudogemmobacter sp. W21_MBD1_M6]|uniref:ABC transporter substrate-binding protein n=1 Tax=Pseudogemmobacter sp. W21_MBD1_M6 TaxID=3240271 RepID=UPI003F949AB6
MKFLHIFCGLCLLAGQAGADTLRAAVLEIGTVNWELDTIKHNGFDTRNGFDLKLRNVANNAATQIAFQGGDVDVIVSDWIWVARQRAEGRDYVFIPYSKAVGNIMLPEGSDITSFEQLKGHKIGIAGGPLDKSWIILRAYAQSKYGFDLQAETEQVFAAPPLIFKAGLSGEVDAAINFWHFAAKMEAAGMTSLISVSQAAEELGLDPETPLLGYVVKGEMLTGHPELVQGLRNASHAAKALLASDDAAWDRLRPMMNAKSDAQFAALVAGFRAGIPTKGDVDELAAGRLLKVMSDLGGPELVGKATRLPEGLFVN